MTEWLDEHLINVTLEGENAETKEIADVDLLLDNLVVRRLITGSSEHLNSLGKTWQQLATARRQLTTWRQFGIFWMWLV